MQMPQRLHLVVDIRTMTTIGAAGATFITHHTATAHHASPGAVHLDHALGVVCVIGRSKSMLQTIVASGKGSIVVMVPVVVIRHQGGIKVGCMAAHKRIVIGFGLPVIGLQFLGGFLLVGSDLVGHLLAVAARGEQYNG